jgi:hypothetical protein
VLASTLDGLARLIVAQSKRGAVVQYFWLWVGLCALGVVAVAIIWALSSSLMRARLRTLGTGRRRRRPLKDAWVEAGRRAEPIPHDDLFEDEPPEPEAPR